MTAPGTDSLRNELADRMDALPPEDWSSALLKAMIALLELELDRAASREPAPVLQLVRPDTPDV